MGDCALAAWTPAVSRCLGRVELLRVVRRRRWLSCAAATIRAEAFSAVSRARPGYRLRVPCRGLCERQQQYRFGTVCALAGKYWNATMDVAVDNGGYVTPSLVAAAGVPAVELRKMVSRGTLTSAGHGVYRVPPLPHDRFDEFILARLWAAGRGVVSHDSALVVHELCDINPLKVHLTIPSSYRISRAGGERYALHRAELAAGEVTRVEAVTVTTVRRTLSDVVGAVPVYLARQAIDNARQRGAISQPERDELVARATGVVAR